MDQYWLLQHTVILICNSCVYLCEVHREISRPEPSHNVDLLTVEKNVGSLIENEPAIPSAERPERRNSPGESQ